MDRERYGDAGAPTLGMTPVLYNEHDGVDAVRVRESQGDPLIMYLVAPRRPSASGGELLSHAAIATVRCVECYESDPSWSEAFAEWQRSSFRKVCLRARPVELERVRALDHAEGGELVCLPPRRRSAAEPELSSLQAHVGGALTPAEGDSPEPDGRAMVMLMCEDLGMTVGKACAQVAHAVLIASDLHSPAAVTGWRDAGSPVDVRLVDRETFTCAKRELTVAAVRDAGVTQVAPGTETVLATEPGSRLPAWLLAARRRSSKARAPRATLWSGVVRLEGAGRSGRRTYFQTSRASDRLPFTVAPRGE